MTSNGVASAAAKKLIASYESGIVWDSMSGSAPVSTYSASDRDGLGTTVRTYADSSIRVSSIGGSDSSSSLSALRGSVGSVSPQRVSQCVAKPVAPQLTDYFNCKVEDSSGVVTGRFYADVRRAPTGSTILAANRGEIFVVAGSWSGKSGPSIVRATSLGAGVPAVARMSWTANTGVGTFSQYEELQVPTSGSMASVGSF